MSLCPSELELTRVLDPAGLGATKHELHLGECASCRQFVDSLAAAITLARELPVDLPAAGRREEVRTAVLAAAAAQSDRPAASYGRSAPAFGLAAAAVLAGYFVSASSSSVPDVVAHATVHPLAGADFTSSSGPPDEIVRLRDGTIDLDVDKLRPGERFRVVVGDGEVEVRGTAFEVTASADHLTAVRVVHGRVEVTLRGVMAKVLGAGESWHVAPTPTVALVPAGAPAAPAEPVRPATRAIVDTKPRVEHHSPGAVRPVSARAPTGEEVAYNEGWGAMRTGDFRGAAAAFGRSLALSPAGALAEDAGYWHAVALARVPRPAEAIGAFRDFLDAHPLAPRAGEASAMLGWLLVQAHDVVEAERRFRVASNDPSAVVQQSAKAGLAALAGAP